MDRATGEGAESDSWAAVGRTGRDLGQIYGGGVGKASQVVPRCRAYITRWGGGEKARGRGAAVRSCQLPLAASGVSTRVLTSLWPQKQPWEKGNFEPWELVGGPIWPQARGLAPRQGGGEEGTGWSRAWELRHLMGPCGRMGRTGG